MARRYFGQRNAAAVAPLELKDAVRLFVALVSSFSSRQYFDEAFGYKCVDEGFVAGSAGRDVAGYIEAQTWVDAQWPLDESRIEDEDGLFTLIEFLYDHVSKPLKGRHHTYKNCGWHYSTFDSASGQAEFRSGVNNLLSRMPGGFVLSEDGEVERHGGDGLGALMERAVVGPDGVHVGRRVAHAVSMYRSRASTREDLRSAVRELVDVLEYLRPAVKVHMGRKDEAALFEIANRFMIRHNNPAQLGEYSDEWLDWLFFVYLASIHLVRGLEQADSD